jgi:hypothetical protein
MSSNNILLITGCSKRKLDHEAPAEDLNQGQLFKKAKKLAKQNKFDFKIISGKYGLLEPDQIIEPYNKKIRNKQDIERIRKEVIPRMLDIYPKYSLIILIMGKTYEHVFEPVLDNKFRRLYHKQGYFGYLKLINKLLTLKQAEVLTEIEKFTAPQCVCFEPLLDEADTPQNCNFCVRKSPKEPCCQDQTCFTISTKSTKIKNKQKTLTKYLE